jgi:hypothetical protein
MMIPIFVHRIISDFIPIIAFVERLKLCYHKSPNILEVHVFKELTILDANLQLVSQGSRCEKIVYKLVLT